jgi:hypothetical protein
VLELDNIKVGRWVKNPLITRVIFTKLTEEQEAKRQIHIDKKRRKGKKPLSAQKNISINIFLTNIPQNMVKKEDVFSIYSLRW